MDLFVFSYFLITMIPKQYSKNNTCTLNFRGDGDSWICVGGIDWCISLFLVCEEHLKSDVVATKDENIDYIVYEIHFQSWVHPHR